MRRVAGVLTILLIGWTALASSVAADWETRLPGKPPSKSLLVFPVKVSGLEGPDKYKGDPVVLEAAFRNHLYNFFNLNAPVDMTQTSSEASVSDHGESQPKNRAHQKLSVIDSAADIGPTLFAGSGKRWFSEKVASKSLSRQKFDLGLIVEVHEIFYQGKNGLYEVKCRYAIVGRKGGVLTKGMLSFKNPRVTLFQKEAWRHTFNGMPNGEPYALFARELLKVLNTVL